MTPTELKLPAIHKGPVARLRDSRKAPLMVRVVDLAAHIDAVSECAKESWDNSQV